MFFSVMVAKTFAFTHLVKKSMPTTRNFSYLTVVRNVPMISSHHCANDQGAVMGVSSSYGCLMKLLNL